MEWDKMSDREQEELAEEVRVVLSDLARGEARERLRRLQKERREQDG